jgi:hypothetical protein
MTLADREKMLARSTALFVKLQECETEAHTIGLHRGAHAINAAKNIAGLELAGSPEKAREQFVGRM